MMTRPRPFLLLAFTVSMALNIVAAVLLWRHYAATPPESAPECRLYPEQECSMDFPASVRDQRPIFSAYSIRGDRTVFLDFSLQGTLAESVEAKYGRELPNDLVRNIQTLIYFFLDYQVRLGTNDRVALFYRPSDNRILYLRLRSRSYNAVFEAFFYQTAQHETYATADGSIFPPCLKNGPFAECPPIRLEKRHDVLIPVFLLQQNGEVRFPFDAWVISLTDFSRTGGAVQVTFPDKGLVGFFDYLGTVNPQIKVGKRYKAGTLVGTGGFAKRDGADGVRYYLERRDGTPVSPFFFHHTTTAVLPADEKVNLTITQNFYRNWHRQGQEFEKQHY